MFTVRKFDVDLIGLGKGGKKSVWCEKATQI